MATKKLVLCDTNIFIKLLRGDAQIKEQLTQLGQDRIVLSIITIAELFQGAKKVNY
ncbi:MAG: hypothetical protein RLZZ292_2208 [Bacteroidota bacterium]|jgi:predicted nucleic acid-binding protein